MNEAALKIDLAPKTKVCKCCNKEKPLELFFKNRLGYTSVCKECSYQHRKDKREKKDEIASLRKQIEEKRNLSLSCYTPRELMRELKRRGYSYTMQYTETHIIKSDDIEL